MEELIIKYNDYRNLAKHIVNNKDIELVSNFLKENNSFIKIIENKNDYDARSGWNTSTYILDGFYCIKNTYHNQINFFVSFIKQKKDIDCSVSVSKTEEYKNYLKLKNKFSDVDYLLDKYINNK